jgi:presenilin-like A22 family membrane protease
LLALILTEGISLISLFFLKKEVIATIATPSLTIFQFIIAFFLATAILFLLIKLFRGRFIFELIFSLAIFGGIWFLANLFFSNGIAILLASALTLVRLLVPYIFLQNLIMIFGIAGIASTLGSTTSWQTILLILLILSLYDIIAVYETKHMVTMFKGLLERGVIFALIVPTKLKLLFAHLREARPGEGFFFLGTGDLALPSIFVVSAFVAHPLLGLGSALGSVMGLALTNIIFIRENRRPMPALPPITLGTVFGFFVAFVLIKFF